jgi:hypothetical protein
MSSGDGGDGAPRRGSGSQVLQDYVELQKVEIEFKKQQMQHEAEQRRLERAAAAQERQLEREMRAEERQRDREVRNRLFDLVERVI